jgi:thiamine-monophosphate kinase
MTNASDTGEFGLIDRIAKIMPGSPDVIEGIGDDCAVIRLGDRVLLASTDLFIEDVHFRWSYMTGEDVGWKAAQAGLSDIAAMGGRPICLLVSLACPADTDADTLEAIATGIAAAARQHDAAVVGGDTTRHPTGVVIDIVALGEAVDGRYITRSGAKPGDVLVCTGPLGGSAAGLHALENGIDAPALTHRHKQPSAQGSIGRWLAMQPGIHAMIDISDGLVQDLGHIAKASNVGVDIISKDVPLHANLKAYCAANNLDARTLALTGGEEYHLACTVDSSAIETLLQQHKSTFDTTLCPIGICTGQPDTVTVDGEECTSHGFRHFAS